MSAARRNSGAESTQKHQQRRRVDLAIISDVHLGAKSCRADELRRYLKSIEPRELILNGDIIDMWEFQKGYWPEAHVKVVRRILKLAASGVPVHLITGNHDEALRAYSGMHFGNLHLVDQIERVISGRRTWILHGDTLEAAMSVPRWLSALGTWSYDAAVVVDTWINRARAACGWNRISISQRMKLMLKGAREHIIRYEETCARIAASRGFEAVITGHIHQPNHRTIDIDGRPIAYLNSGDWVDNLTALELNDGAWSIHRFGEEEEIEAGDDAVEPYPGLLKTA